MASDTVYELCLPILQDEALEEEDKTEKLEELLRRDTALKDKQLENAVLDVLWRYKDGSNSTSSPPPSRHTVIRSTSPAPWQLKRAVTPLASSPRSSRASPAPPPGFGIAPAAFTRAKSSTASPFTSPRPSPRLAVATPQIPHSPNLNAYEFSGDQSPSQELYGDYGSDTVDWLVNEETASNSSSLGEVVGVANGAEWLNPYTMDMSPYDMLRSILRDERSDEEYEKVLEANGYDLSQTIMALTDAQSLQAQQVANDQERTILVGKSMASAVRPSTPAGQAKTPVVCRYYLSTGSCARADCRFSHDLSGHICKYWLAGSCLAGDTCVFSHDPAALFSRLNFNGSQTPPSQTLQPDIQANDYTAFPSLHGSSPQQWPPEFHPQTYDPTYGSSGAVAPPPGLQSLNSFISTGSSSLSRPHSRPSSRHTSRATTPLPGVDDNDAFPALGASSGKSGKRHHGKRGGHGHGHREPALPNSLADVVRMSPSPVPNQQGSGSSRRGPKANKSFAGSRENSATAAAIPAPEHVPWLETGDAANKAYMKARQEAFKHGGLRNKFLQSAAQAWNRNDSRGAKALSLRGQNENNLMREAHREAARVLYEERNKDVGRGKELYVDLHGLHPEEAVSYLESCLLEQRHATRPVYAITGTGHHSKNGKDKVGKAVRAFLNEWRYAFREFSVPGDRSNIGGILGVDPASFEKGGSGGKAGKGNGGEVGSVDGEGGEEVSGEGEGEGREGEGGSNAKVRVLREEDIPKGPRRRL
ncbi:MAG: hypothetical protein M1821_008592 [Bathelium mastoideum]|nr:MAG: hypothetical protein M1821_008592 [Bathelium mastoideum]